MDEDGAAVPDAGQPVYLESKDMSVIKQHKSVVFLVGAFAIMIVVGVLTS